MLKVTVITVCFNSADTIADTLRSVAAQTHPCIEHIIVDGASQDDTLGRVREYGAHVTHVVSEHDHGIYDAMNKGLALATGDLIGFLNADDIFNKPESVAKIAMAAERVGADAVYGDLEYVRSDNTDTVVRLWRSGEFQPARLRFGWMPPHPTFYVRRALMHEVGGFNLQLRIAADYDFALRFLSASQRQIAYVPEVLVRMRLGGVSNRSVKSMWNKSREDLIAIRGSNVGGVGTLLYKNLRKLPQFFSRRN